MNELMSYSKELNQIFPFIKDKMVIDFVNGLDTAKKLNKHNQKSKGFLERNLALLSGKTQHTQNNINDHVMVGLEACNAYIQEITAHERLHAQTIQQLHQTLSATELKTAEIANYVADLQEQVDDMYANLNSRIQRLEISDRANSQMDSILTAWEAEQFHDLSPMGQCFLVLDTLKWGDYGFYLTTLDDNQKHSILQTLKNKMIVIQKNLMQQPANEDILKSIWLTPMRKNETSNVLQPALQYQGDWSWENPNYYNMAFTATQLPSLEDSEKSEFNGLVIDMIDIERVNSRMLNDVFKV